MWAHVVMKLKLKDLIHRVYALIQKVRASDASYHDSDKDESDDNLTVPSRPLKNLPPLIMLLMHRIYGRIWNQVDAVPESEQVVLFYSSSVHFSGFSMTLTSLAVRIILDF